MLVVKYPNKKYYIQGRGRSTKRLQRRPEVTYRCGYLSLRDMATVFKENDDVCVVEYKTGEDITEGVLRALALLNINQAVKNIEPCRLRYFALNDKVEL